MGMTDQPRLRSSRTGVDLSIRRASPLTLAIAKAERPPLDRILRRLRPPTGGKAPWRPPAHQLGHRHTRLMVAHYVSGASAREDAAFRANYGPRGVIVRKPSHPRGPYAVWVADGSLNAVVSLGRLALHAEGGTGRLELPWPLPDVLAAAIVGRHVDAVAEHPLLSGRGWTVTGTAEENVRTTITFETGTVPIRPPFRLGESGFADRRSRHGNAPD